MSRTRLATVEIPWSDFGVQYDDRAAPLENLLIAMFQARYGDGEPDALLEGDGEECGMEGGTD